MKLAIIKFSVGGLAVLISYIVSVASMEGIWRYICNLSRSVFSFNVYYWYAIWQ